MVPRRSKKSLRFHVAALAALLLLGCRDCRDSDESWVAELIEHQGEVQRVQLGEGSSPVSPAQRFFCNDGVRTGKGAWARLMLATGGRFRLEENTLIRLPCEGSSRGLAVELGETEIETSTEGDELLLEFGKVRLSKDGRYRVRKGDGSSEFVVVVGTARVEREGKEEELEAGDSMQLAFEIGKITVQRHAKETDKPAPADAGVPQDTAAEDTQPNAAAITVAVSGRRAKSRLPGERSYQDLKQGSHDLPPGTALRLGRGSKAEVSRGEERAIVRGPADVILASPEDKRGSFLRAESGSATAQAAGNPMTIGVPGGFITTRSGAGGASQASLDVGRRSTKVQALRGTLEITGKDGSREVIELGESAELGSDGTIQVRGRAPKRADFELSAGESPTIHDPSPPTAVAVTFTEVCSQEGGEGIVEVSPNARFRGGLTTSKGQGRANILLSQRAHYYRVRCLQNGVPSSEVAAKGILRVSRDAGTRALPKRPPSNRVDADGRRYTVLYQNLLPEITFAWPGVSGPGEYTLSVSSEGKEVKRVSTKEPRYRLAAGQLNEGTYAYYFEGNGMRSQTSTLRIEFDNAAPSAYLRLPKANQEWTGNSLRVEGAALPDWTVRVDNERVPTDRQGRFSAIIALPVEDGAIVVRLSHPQRGVHYYVRRDKRLRR